MSAFAFLLLANIVFVTPQAGGQAVGPQWIEITTDAKNVDRVEFYVDRVLAGVARTAPYRIAFDFGSTTLTSREITAKVLSNGYRTTESATISTAALTAGELINVDLVEVPLRVRSAKTLRSDDLRVRENNVEQTIRDIKPARDAAHFVFVVDRSLSMGGGKIEAALGAVNEALQLLRADDSASLVWFNHVVGKPVPLPLPRISLMPSGGTSLRDAVASASTSERTYTLVITDGGDRNSQLDEEDALRRISTTRSIVAAVVFGTPNRFLQKATANTGGSLVGATRENVAAKLRAIITDINSRYILVYQSHGTKSGWRSIDIRPRRRGIDILASRKGYFAG